MTSSISPTFLTNISKLCYVLLVYSTVLLDYRIHTDWVLSEWHHFWYQIRLSYFWKKTYFQQYKDHSGGFIQYNCCSIWIWRKKKWLYIHSATTTVFYPTTLCGITYTADWKSFFTLPIFDVWWWLSIFAITNLHREAALIDKGET